MPVEIRGDFHEKGRRVSSLIKRICCFLSPHLHSEDLAPIKSVIRSSWHRSQGSTVPQDGLSSYIVIICPAWELSPAIQFFSESRLRLEQGVTFCRKDLILDFIWVFQVCLLLSQKRFSEDVY